MKKIIILIALLFGAQSSFALIVSDYAPPYFSVDIQITNIDRSENNDANLIITGDTYLFDGQKNTYRGRNFESEINTFILRDKTKLVESSLEKGYIISAQVPYDQSYSGQREFRFDESNPSNIIIYNANEEKIAETINLSLDRKGKQFLHAFSEADAIISIGRELDCMAGTNEMVCHPELDFNIFSDRKIYSETLKTGDGLSVDLYGYKSIFVTDAHIYKQHDLDDQDYVRVQLFAKNKLEKYKQPYSSVFHRATSPEKLSENPHCNYFFSEESLSLEKKCSWKSYLFNTKKWVKGFFKNKEPDYGMIAC